MTSSERLMYVQFKSCVKGEDLIWAVLKSVLKVKINFIKSHPCFMGRVNPIMSIEEFLLNPG